jgi:hypothetical protein
MLLQGVQGIIGSSKMTSLCMMPVKENGVMSWKNNALKTVLMEQSISILRMQQHMYWLGRAKLLVLSLIGLPAVASGIPPHTPENLVMLIHR